MKTLTEQDFMMEKKGKDAIGNATIKKLMAQEKETIHIPSEHENDKLWEGNINGVRIHVKKNEYVQVPKAVAEVVRNNTNVLKAGANLVKKYTEGSGPKLADM